MAVKLAIIVRYTASIEKAGNNKKSPATQTSKAGYTNMDIVGLGTNILGAFCGQSQRAHNMQMMATDYQNAQTIYASIDAQAQKSAMERWKIASDTQTKIFEIQQEVTVNRAKTQDKMFNKWCDYIKS